jgi:hypothetical protein
MKRAITFSIEDKIVSDFLKETGEKRNFIMEKIMFDYVVSKKEIGIIRCKSCGAEYSEKFSECPQCKLDKNLTTVLEKRQSIIQQMRNRLSMLERVRTSGGSTDAEINEMRENIKKEEEALNEV